MKPSEAVTGGSTHRKEEPLAKELVWCVRTKGKDRKHGGSLGKSDRMVVRKGGSQQSSIWKVQNLAGMYGVPGKGRRPIGFRAQGIYQMAHRQSSGMEEQEPT